MNSKNLLALALSMSFASVYAQSQEQVLNSDPIDVDGYLREKQVSDGELESIKSTVQKYKNENMLHKEKARELNKLTNEAEKIGENAEEKIHAQVEAKRAEEKAMQKIKKAEAKLKCLMEQINSPECDAIRGNSDQQVVQNVSTGQAAVATSVAEAPASSLTGRPFEEIKLVPFAGITQYNGRVEQLEAELAAGLKLESNITSRFSMGIGFNYSQFKTMDFANNLFSNVGYYNNFGLAGREIQYQSMGLELYGKFFITSSERFRPYVGAGIGYNRANLKYTENNPFTQFNNGQFQNFGDEAYRTSFASGTLTAGTQIMITRTFGLNIEGAYTTGLGKAMTSESARNPFNSPDQQRLRQLGEEVINSNALSLFGGVVVAF
jgi:hypothetical protein